MFVFSPIFIRFGKHSLHEVLTKILSLCESRENRCNESHTLMEGGVGGGTKISVSNFHIYCLICAKFGISFCSATLKFCENLSIEELCVNGSTVIIS